MSLSNMIYKVRTNSKMSQAAFAQTLNVSPQAVQKWESGASLPELDKIIQIAKRFGISIDAPVLERDARVSEELAYNKKFTPKYANLHPWELYSEDLTVEYRQSIEEGLDISAYEELFRVVAKTPRGENKDRIADVLFDIVCCRSYAEIL